MPIYDLSAVAEALDVELKQLDNLLSRNELPGIEKRRRGVARRLTADLAVVIRLAKDLAEAIQVSPGSVLRFAHRIEREGRDEVSLGDFVTLRVDLARLHGSTLNRLDAAVETVGRRRRGRPPNRVRPTPIGE